MENEFSLTIVLKYAEGAEGAPYKFMFLCKKYLLIRRSFVH